MGQGQTATEAAKPFTSTTTAVQVIIVHNNNINDY